MSWTYGPSTGYFWKSWKCSSYSDLDIDAINNLVEFGQPFEPGEPGFLDTDDFSPDFDHVIVEMPQTEVMTNGYGKKLIARSFPIVKRFLSEELNFPHGTYDFDDLIAFGFCTKDDRSIKGNLYWEAATFGLYTGGDFTAGAIGEDSAAYVHGSVAAALMSGTRFIFSSHVRRVEAEIGVLDDNFDYQSANIPQPIEVIVAGTMGPAHFNAVPIPGDVGAQDRTIKLLYRGPGRKSVAEVRTDDDEGTDDQRAASLGEAKEISIHFGKIRSRIFQWLNMDVSKSTGSFWDYTYDLSHASYEGKTQPIPGPDCQFTPGAFGCYSAPTGINGPEGPTPWDHVTLRPGSDSFIYLDVGFWGANRRDFGLVCGPEVWLCSFGEPVGAPKPYGNIDSPSYTLYSFFHCMQNFTVVSHATSYHHDSYAASIQIDLILPDMHMWPDPQGLCDHRYEFLRFWDLITAPLSHLAAEKHIENVEAMRKEEHEHNFGGAGRHLVRLLTKVKEARKAGFNVRVTQVGDLFEMWAPVATLIDNFPMDPHQWLQLTDVAKQNIPKWLRLVYENPSNRQALDLILDPDMQTQHVYGNHDVYLATEWNSTGIDKIDRLKGSRAWLLHDLVWIEHGHRFQVNNSDGYWLAQDFTHPAGPTVTTAVNYYPGLRKFADILDSPPANLYAKNIPYASVWYLLAHHAHVPANPDTKFFAQPPKYRIFCQGHTHNHILLKVHVSWTSASVVFTPAESPKASAAGAH
jgi:hypothetical protein